MGPACLRGGGSRGCVRERLRIRVTWRIAAADCLRLAKRWKVHSCLLKAPNTKYSASARLCSNLVVVVVVVVLCVCFGGGGEDIPFNDFHEA